MNVPFSAQIQQFSEFLVSYVFLHAASPHLMLTLYRLAAAEQYYHTTTVLPLYFTVGYSLELPNQQQCAESYRHARLKSQLDVPTSYIYTGIICQKMKGKRLNRVYPG